MRGSLVWVFRLVIIPLLRLTTRVGGESAWQMWETLSVKIARLVGYLARSRQSYKEIPIVMFMKIIDLADDLIGAEGQWEEAGPRLAVKRIYQCPLAHYLRKTPAFCTRLGTAMGYTAFDAYAPEASIAYEIPRTQSQGLSFCEYILMVDAEEDRLFYRIALGAAELDKSVFPHPSR